MNLFKGGVLVFALVILAGCVAQPSGTQAAGASQNSVSGELGVFEEDNDAPPAPPSRQAPALPEEGVSESQSSASAFTGLWKVFSSRIFYDVGGAGGMTGTTRLLEIDAEGNWAFGSSNGKWHVEPIAETDWNDWGIDAYGPTRKMVLDDWGGKDAEGPIEESGGSVDFFWAIYRVESPEVENAGTIQTKFGRAAG
ncbi:hypothetical protein J4220_00090 [Candidatus Micrarchaeota archaeon]|nr:hypothetical protein [Candidatus Micrarchaeota archaeon]